ncbi:hypothetical protein BGY98DRAFT_1101316 [Russula aff. rugulosa BPL654]|nr:hypothetical protein BGY98DRAFT_1101316 [Russula aff. rugulosa BPL654]
MPAAVALKRLHSHRRPQLADWRPEYAEETVIWLALFATLSSLLTTNLSDSIFVDVLGALQMLAPAAAVHPPSLPATSSVPTVPPPPPLAAPPMCQLPSVPTIPPPPLAASPMCQLPSAPTVPPPPLAASQPRPRANSSICPAALYLERERVAPLAPPITATPCQRTIVDHSRHPLKATKHLLRPLLRASDSLSLDSPSPTPAPPPVQTSLVTRRPSVPLPQSSPTVAAAQEETSFDNQENRPPTPRPILLPNPYAPPACTQDLSGHHPHQYYIIRHETHDSWQPVTTRDSATLLNFVSQDELLRTPPNFPTVIAFKGPSHHTSLVAPTDQFQARLFRIPTLILCTRAGLSPPTHDVPLGYIHYSFRASVRDLFSSFPTHVQLCFLGALIVSEIHDFLDGRVIFTYGHLRFDSGRIYIVNQAYYFDDSIRTNPNLLRFTLSPRLPIDPFTFTCPFRDETPL